MAPTLLLRAASPANPNGDWRRQRNNLAADGRLRWVTAPLEDRDDDVRCLRRVLPFAPTPPLRQEEVYLTSLINKGSVVAKGKLVTTDAQREIGGRKLGTEYAGVYVEGLENVERGNKGDEEVPRPYHQIRKLIDAIGYVIPCPSTHVKKARSSSRTRNKLVPAVGGQS